MRVELKDKPWWDYLSADLRGLLLESIILLENTTKLDHVFDYSYIVFPAAKAYEGFLKKMFLDLGFISREEYTGKRFRIGRALNPDLSKELGYESIYDKLKSYCGGEELPDRLWETWKECRNSVFHFFPGARSDLSLEDSKQKVSMIIESIDISFKDCKLQGRVV
jgi:hypothetical protein